MVSPRGRSSSGGARPAVIHLAGRRSAAFRPVNTSASRRMSQGWQGVGGGAAGHLVAGALARRGECGGRLRPPAAGPPLVPAVLPPHVPAVVCRAGVAGIERLRPARPERQTLSEPRTICGRTVLVTGATDGIGKETARGLARQGARVLLHGRDAGRRRAARRDIVSSTGNEQVEIVLADFQSLRPGARAGRRGARPHRPSARAGRQRRRLPGAPPPHRGRSRDDLPGRPSGPVPAHEPAARPPARRGALAHRRGELGRAPAGRGSTSTICRASAATTATRPTLLPSSATCSSPTSSPSACAAAVSR